MACRPAGVFSIAVMLCIMVEEGKGGPALDAGLAAASSSSSSSRHVRTKRCSCNSWQDKECIYFCHLDIIWVNTPGQTSPYGLGNPTRRRKRSLGRCECSRPNDSSCSSFCQPKPRDILGSSEQQENRAPQGGREKYDQGTNLLRALRDVASSNSLKAKWRRSLLKRSQPGLRWMSTVLKRRR